MSHANRYNPKCNLLINGGILAILVEKRSFSHLFETFILNCEARSKRSPKTIQFEF